MLVSILQISKILSIFQKKNSKEVNFNRVFFKKNRNEDEHNLHYNRMNQFLNVEIFVFFKYQFCKVFRG